MQDERNLPAVPSRTVHARFTLPELREIATNVAQSRLFPGIESPQAALTLMLLCESENLHPMQALRRFHVIEGRPAMRADAMQAEFQHRGGVLRWVRSDADECRAEFSHPQYHPEPVAIAVTIKELIDSGVGMQWNAKQNRMEVKGVYRKYPAQMLRARVISQGVRMVLPGVVAGIYTPEEVGDFDEPRRPLPPPPVEAPVDPPGTVVNGKGRDARPYHELCRSGVEATNKEFADEFPGASDLVNQFQLDRHMTKAAVTAGLMPDPGKRVKALELSKQLTLLYQTPEGRPWVRREMAEYLATKLREARAAAALEGEGDGAAFDELETETEAEAQEVTVEELRAEGREPGQEG